MLKTGSYVMGAPFSSYWR